MLVKDQPHPSQSQIKGRSPANTSSSYSPQGSKRSDGSNGQTEPLGFYSVATQLTWLLVYLRGQQHQL